MEFPLVTPDELKNTKDKILLTAATMFTEKGYAAVSVRDIAKQVDIKAATIYSHYKSKEVLFDTIVETVEKVYLDFYNRMDEGLAKAACFADALSCLFSELKDVYHIFVHHGLSLIATEQFRNEKARAVFNDVYMKFGIEYSVRVFNECIKRKWVKEFDTETLATLFMHSVFVGTIMRTQEGMGFQPIYDITEMFEKLERYMLNSVEIMEPQQADG